MGETTEVSAFSWTLTFDKDEPLPLHKINVKRIINRH